MGSIMAEHVAKTVLKTVRSGKKVNMTQIHRDHGYSEVSALSQKATKSKTYKKEIQPFVKRLERFRDKLLSELEQRDISEERFADIGRSLKDTTHDIQLLSGKATENVGIAHIFSKVAEHETIGGTDSQSVIETKEKPKSLHSTNMGIETAENKE